MVEKDFSFFTLIFRTSPPEVFLGKGVLKICSNFTREHSYRNAISIKFRFGMNVFLEIYYIFLEHL